MARAGRKSAENPRPRAPRDFGRLISQLFCVLFALVGLVPLSGGLILRSRPIQTWAARETSRVLAEQLGVHATFSVQIDVVPLRLAVTHLVVPSNDGGAPAVSTRLAAISPRFFSLLAGRLDVGDIELEDSSVRMVVRNGRVANLDYRLPARSKDASSPELKRAPFRSLTVTSARLDLDVEGTHVQTDAIDMDVFAEPELSFDVALRMAGATLDSTRTQKKGGGRAHDEDRLCALDLRAQLSPRQVSVRRLSLLGAVDLDPASGTRPACDVTGPEKLAVRLSQLKVTPRADSPIPLLKGRVMFRAPAGITNRFVATDLTGWAGFSGEVDYDGTTRLPEINGQLSGAGLSMAGKAIAKRLAGTVQIHADVVRVPDMEADWANGTAWIKGFHIEPFTPGIPLGVDHIVSEHMNFPGVMRDVGITPNTIVDWNYDHVDIDKVKGAIRPFSLDGSVSSRSSNFAVYDKAYHDPAKRRMIGVHSANIVGRWRANGKSLDFYDIQTTFGHSNLPVELVSISFGGAGNPLIVRLKPGAVLDMADVGPIASLEVAGVAHLDVALEGHMEHPSLDGKISVEGLQLGGFELGNLAETKVHFEPLFVEFENLNGTRREMKYHSDSARLDFDGPASVEFTANTSSDTFDIREFFRIFHFDDDPRFADVSGRGKVKARVRYVMGGPEDECESGRLRVEGQSELTELEFLGEGYNVAETTFDLDWFDIDAGVRGFRLDVPVLALRKGSGTIIGDARVGPGGTLGGHLLGSHIALARIDSLRSFFGQADGFVTGVGRLEGRLEQLGFTANVHVSDVKARGASLPPSDLTVRLIPDVKPLETSGKISGCGRALPPVFDKAERRDTRDGVFRVDGRMFGDQVLLDDVELTSQKDRILSGKVKLQKLDLGALVALAPQSALLGQLPHGSLSGSAELERVYVKHPFDSRAKLVVSGLESSVAGYRVSLVEQAAEFTVQDGSVESPRFTLRVATPDGKSGLLDGHAKIARDKSLSGALVLRETPLGVVASAVPGIDRAEGRLFAGVSLGGKLSSPALSGYLEVQNGRVVLSHLISPLTDLNVRVDMDASGWRFTRGTATWGGGTVEVDGGAPFAQGTLGTTRLRILAKGVTLPIEDDVRVGFDANLDLMVPTSAGEVSEARDGKKELPRLTGTVDLNSASYTRAMTATADIAALTGRGHKTEVDTFDPDQGNLELDVLIRAKRPLVVKNALVDCALDIDPNGLRLVGTDRHLGALGSVAVVPGGHIFLRRNSFEVKSGLVRLNDPTRLRPEVDVSAVTDFRRFENPAGTQATVSSTATTSGGGSWRIRLRAYGPPDDLRVDLASDPPLAQDDIFLLLTVGLTRTELDQARSAGVGSSAALEALGSLSGAESAVTDTVPIDEFRFGSVYSARSGRTEPTVTIGKRLGERLRASVTTSLSDTNEVRSNVEYRATPQMSVEGSYDNAQRAGAPALGNLGGDVRWRLEFD